MQGCGLVPVQIPGGADANACPVRIDSGWRHIGQAVQDACQSASLFIGAKDRLVFSADRFRQFSRIGTDDRIVGEGIQPVHLMQIQEQKLNHLSQTSMPENPHR